jgi:Lipocalin-like domain
MKTSTTKWALTAVVFASTMLFSCKKDRSTEPDCSISMQNLAGSYKLTALKYKLNATTPEMDYLPFMEDCEKDDVVTLKSNGTYDYHDAGIVCTPGGTDNGTWGVSGNTISSDGSTINGTIASYDCKTLVYYTENFYATGDKITFTIVKQ